MTLDQENNIWPRTNPFLSAISSAANRVANLWPRTDINVGIKVFVEDDHIRLQLYDRDTESPIGFGRLDRVEAEVLSELLKYASTQLPKDQRP